MTHRVRIDPTSDRATSGPDAPWPAIGLGCASLGQPSIDDATAERVIARAIEHGIRFFDVAPLYGGGLGECRLGRALQASGLPRDDYVLCTKTGVTRAFGQGAIPPGGTRRREADTWNYSEAATRASIERSCERLGVVHLHDVEHHVDQCLEAWTALDALRDEGVVGAIGIGSNWPEPVSTLLDRRRFDAFLLAGRYTLLDQSGATLIGRAGRDRVRVVAGGVFNSGILGSWPPSSATFNYDAAPPAMLERASRIAAICERHRVAIGAAAMQFVLMNRDISTMLIGPTSVEELDRNVANLDHPIPDALWIDLGDAGLVPRAKQEEAVDAH